MLIYFDVDNNELVQLDEGRDGESPSILCENFSWLLRNLDQFDPTHVLSGKRGEVWNQPGRGTRRKLRGIASQGLGYTYESHAKYNEFADHNETKVTNKGIVTLNNFGYPVNVEIWDVNAPWPVTDSAKGETYKGGPYTCMITARADLRDKKKTRCYVSCNCKDFHYSFKAELQKHGYTNPNEKLPPVGSGSKTVPQAATVCKHIYTILKKFYGKFTTAEHGADPSAELFVDAIPMEEPEAIQQVIAPKPAKKITQTSKKPGLKPQQPIKPVKPVKGKAAPSKAELKNLAKEAIIDAIMEADKAVPSESIDSYQDTRKFSKSKNAVLHYSKYKFVVRVETPDGKAAIYYTNPIMGGSSSGQKVLTIPNYSKANSVYLFTPNELRQFITQFSTEMSPKIRKQLDKLKKLGKIINLSESVIEYSEEMQILNESSPILQGIMELKFRASTNGN